MCTRQGELSAFVVIESRGFPLRTVVTIGAERDLRLGELAAVRVGMTFFALQWSLGEVRIDQPGSEVWRFVAVDAGHGAMRTHERELGLGMIEAGEVFPVFSGVACFTPGSSAVGAEGFHAFGELVAVRILVTGRTGNVLEMINRSRAIVRRLRRRCSLNRSRSREERRAREGRGGLVAIAALHREVAVRKWETRLLVLGQGERRRLEIFHRVALLALIEPWCGCKLCLVFVAMAFQAAVEFDLVKRVFPFGDVALRAFHFCVFAGQRILRRRMRLHVKFRRLPSVDVVAGRALAGVRALYELAVVRVLVAIRAFREKEGFFEITVGVAGSARHCLVLSEQRVFGLGVIEALAQPGGDDALPSRRRMAGLAGLLSEASLVRIAVAIIAFLEGKSHVAGLFVGTGRMTFFALHLGMLPGERIARLGVIERAGDIFPVVEVVASRAIRPQAAAVRILVAGGTAFGDAHEAAIEVFDFDQRPFGGGNMFGCVALLTFHAGVLAFEDVPRLFVIESLDVPFDQRKVESIVIGVALDAFLTRPGPDSVREVQPLVGRQTRGNFAVTVQTPENDVSTQLVTGSAARGAFEVLVRASQWAG